jgi:hypothetical protein
MKLIISPNIEKKLKEKHEVLPKEVMQCFENRVGALLQDTREDHKTDPPTEWFIAETNSGRSLKVCIVQTDSGVFLKTAFEPWAEEIRIYSTHAF